MSELGIRPEYSLINQRLLPFRTAYKDEGPMRNLFGAVTMATVKRCLFCESKRLYMAGIYVPSEGHRVIDIDSGKDMVFGYSLCASHAVKTLSRKGLHEIEDESKRVFMERAEKMGVQWQFLGREDN